MSPSILVKSGEICLVSASMLKSDVRPAFGRGNENQGHGNRKNHLEFYLLYLFEQRPTQTPALNISCLPFTIVIPTSPQITFYCLLVIGTATAVPNDSAPKTNNLGCASRSWYCKCFLSTAASSPGFSPLQIPFHHLNVTSEGQCF